MPEAYSRMENPVNAYFLRDKRGELLPGGRLEFFDSSTDNPAVVFDAGTGLTVSIGSVVYADARGLLPDLELTPNLVYKVRCYDSGGDFQWGRDGVANQVSDLGDRVTALESALEALGEDGGPKNLLTNGSCKAVRDDRLQLGFGVQPTFSLGQLAGVFARVTNATEGDFLRTFNAAFGSTGVYAELNDVSTDNSGAVAELQWRMPSGDGAAISGDDVAFQVKASQDSGGSIDATVTLYKCLTEDDFSNLVTVASGDPVTLASGETTTLTLPVEAPGDLSTGVAVVVSFACGIVSNTNFTAGEAQLERGLIATQFEDRPQRIDQAAWQVGELTPDLLPVGMVAPFPRAFTSGYWLECNGQAVSRTTYPRLFAFLGTRYGPGDGSTTFNLPDYRGRFHRGQDDGAGRDPDAASRTNRGDGTTGDNPGTIQGDAFKSHNHQQKGAGTSTGSGTKIGDATLTTGDTNVWDGEATGGSETRPKNIYVVYYIHI